MGKYSLAYNNPYLLRTDCMPAFINKYWPYLLLLLFAIPLFGMNVHSYHQWGDDYAQNIKAMLYLITLFLAILLFVLYSYFRKSSSAPTAVCLSVIVVYCSYIIDFKQHVLSDIPCLLFV